MKQTTIILELLFCTFAKANLETFIQQGILHFCLGKLESQPTGHFVVLSGQTCRLVPVILRFEGVKFQVSHFHPNRLAILILHMATFNQQHVSANWDQKCIG